MSTNLYPMYFSPSYQPYLWGGRKLETVYSRKLPEGIVAESWEISDRLEGMGIVKNGPLAGQNLAELVAEKGSNLLGSRVSTQGFPLLIKVLDAQQVLSVQVHPNDTTAAAFGGEAKTEMWYVLQADPGAQVYCGLKPGTDEEAYRDALAQGNVKDLLTAIPVQAGDAIYVPGGRVHAIDAGCLLLEVQQNSNTTYRIYDWDRVGADGVPRELHFEQALEVIQWDDTEDAKVSPVLYTQEGLNEIWTVLQSPYFLMEKLVLKQPLEVALDGGSFQVLFCADGDAVVSGGEEYIQMRPGMSVLLPAGMTDYKILTENAELLRVSVP